MDLLSNSTARNIASAGQATKKRKRQGRFALTAFSGRTLGAFSTQPLGLVEARNRVFLGGLPFGNAVFVSSRSTNTINVPTLFRKTIRAVKQFLHENEPQKRLVRYRLTNDTAMSLQCHFRAKHQCVPVFDSQENRVWHGSVMAMSLQCKLLCQRSKSALL